MNDDTIVCKYCGSTEVQGRGIKSGKHQYQCVSKSHPDGVKRYFSIGEDENVEIGLTSEYEVNDNFINVILASPRILTEEDIINQFEIDTTKWRIESLQVKTSEGYRKDRQVDWHIDNGVVTKGDSVDSGKMLVVPLFHIRAKFVRKTEEIRARLAIDDLLADIKKYPIKFPKIKYPHFPDGMMYEIDMPDIHFGRLTWGEESGEDYDIKIAYNAVHTALDTLLGLAKNYPISQILLPFGNDYFNVNSKMNTTAHGTPQQEDTRWSKTFTKGRRLAQEIIEKCSTIAPVKVVIVLGNHDEEKMYYLGDLLSAVYEKNPNVTVDNSPKTKKYHLHGVNLVGFAHGYDEKLYKLPSLMALDEPEMWAKSKYREFHTGDKHHKYDTDEGMGVVVRILRALAAPDAWTINNGFVGAVRAAESFLWHPEKGVIAQFTALPYN